jgi:hypothetical protein
VRVAEVERGSLKERLNAGRAGAKILGVQLDRPATINWRAAEITNLKATRLGFRASPGGGRCRRPQSTMHCGSGIGQAGERVAYGRRRR